MPVSKASDVVARPNGRRIAAATAAISAAGAGVYWRARMINPYRPVLECLDILLPPVHSDLDGLRIGFATDIHAGPFIAAEDVGTALDLLREAQPDLVLFGGDFVSESPRHLHRALPAIERLVAASPLGGLAVLGNHDLFVSASSVISALNSIGLPVLRNEARLVPWNETGLWIAGIDDTLHGRPDPEGTFAQPPDGAPVLALWHEAEFAETSARLGAIGQLSGHSHGGQVVFPGIRPVWLPKHGRRHVSGMNSAEGMPVYTSRGMGVYRPPFRFNCPPEVTVLTLRAGDAASDAGRSAK